MEYASGKSPYRLPVINNYLIPVPPPTLQKGDRSVKAVRNGTSRRRRFRPTTAPNGLEQLVAKVGYLSTFVFMGKYITFLADILRA